MSLLRMLHVVLYYAIFSVLCSLVIACWESSDLLIGMSIMFSCYLSVSHMVFRDMVVSIPDLYLHVFFHARITKGFSETAFCFS